MCGRIALVIGVLFQVGCAALLNSDRPAYHGPIQSAAWHNASVEVEQTPMIVDGAVYAIARSVGAAGSPRVYGFDLETGKELWHSAYPVARVVAADRGTVIVSDSENRVHVVDPATGREIAVPEAAPFAKAVFSGSRLYAVRTQGVEALVLPKLSAQWRVAIPLTDPLAPVVAGDRVYVLGAVPWEFTNKTGGFLGLYAFDAQTGAAAWKWELPDRVGSFSAMGLAADDSGVYVLLNQRGHDGFSNGLLIKFDAVSGGEKWRGTSGSTAFEAILRPPDLVVIPDNPAGKEANANSSGYVFRALNRANGAKVWESQTPWKYGVASFSGGLLLASDHSVHQLINENNERSPDSWVSVVDLRAGKELWRSPVMELAVLTAPVASANMMVAGSKVYRFNDVRGRDEVAGLWGWRLSR
jgi:outer membrane protein assembly factor BamB